MLPDPNSQPVITVIEAGKLLGVGKDTAYRAVAKGQIPSLRVGRRLVVPTARFLAEVLGIKA